MDLTLRVCISQIWNDYFFLNHQVSLTVKFLNFECFSSSSSSSLRITDSYDWILKDASGGELGSVNGDLVVLPTRRNFRA